MIMVRLYRRVGKVATVGRDRDSSFESHQFLESSLTDSFTKVHQILLPKRRFFSLAERTITNLVFIRQVAKPIR